MNAEQFDSLNMWMAIVAIAAVVQFLAMATLAIVGYRLYSRHVAPLTRRVNTVLDNAEAVTGGITTAASSVRDVLLPGYAVTRGVWAAVSAFRKSGRRQ